MDWFSRAYPYLATGGLLFSAASAFAARYSPTRLWILLLVIGTVLSICGVAAAWRGRELQARAIAPRHLSAEQQGQLAASLSGLGLSSIDVDAPSVPETQAYAEDFKTALISAGIKVNGVNTDFGVAPVMNTLEVAIVVGTHGLTNAQRQDMPVNAVTVKDALSKIGLEASSISDTSKPPGHLMLWIGPRQRVGP
jgi:hypothetical protein